MSLPVFCAICHGHRHYATHLAHRGGVWTPICRDLADAVRDRGVPASSRAVVPVYQSRRIRAFEDTVQASRAAS